MYITLNFMIMNICSIDSELSRVTHKKAQYDILLRVRTVAIWASGYCKGRNSLEDEDLLSHQPRVPLG